MSLLELSIPTAILLTVSTCLYLLWRKYSSSSPLSHLPVPPGPSWVTATWSLVRGICSGYFHLEVGKWGKGRGPGGRVQPVTCCSSLAGSFVSLNTAQVVREVLTGTHSEDLVNDRPPTFIGPFLFYGPKDVAMASMSPSWGAQRKMFHSSLRLYGDGVHRFESTVQGELSRLIEELEEVEGSDICIEDYMSDTLLSILVILMTGKRPAKNSDMVKAMRQLDRTISRMGTPSVDVILQYFPVMRYLPGWFRNMCSSALRYRDQLVETLFQHSKATVTAGHPRGIVDVMVLAQQSGAFHVTDDHVKGLILDIVVGGYVTSLTSFLSTVLVLLNHPHVARAIQQEIDSAVGQRTPTIDDRKHLHYTEATLLEVLRYMRFFPLGLPHFCHQDIEVNGYRIPKDSLIFANQWECGRDSTTWEEADRFKPERFLDDNGHLLPADHPRRKNLLPFGVGKRTCPGETFARTRLFLLITTLLQRFDFLPPEDGTVIPLDDIPWISGAVLLPPAFRCRVQRRAS
ncbi:cytochrome P450 2B19-like [Babylonia areolata]|uniref:cytochrome P450 2B19-like n=1 Tax=Babylonia areolata TaxID=304850 RepID=UPI003FCEFF2A